MGCLPRSRDFEGVTCMGCLPRSRDFEGVTCMGCLSRSRDFEGVTCMGCCHGLGTLKVLPAWGVATVSGL